MIALLEPSQLSSMFTAPYKVGPYDGLKGAAMPQVSTQLPSETETLSESDFFMFCFKIQPCPIKSTHPWERCCYAHPHENARRRDPRQYKYIAEPCPDYKRGICLLGVQCPYAHGVYERNLHPSKYRTQLCTEGNHCSRHVCFFAHSPYQLRAPTHLWTIEEAEYVRQVLLEKIILESEQAALREQAASLLAASHPVVARPGTMPGAAGFGAPAQQPASGMKAFHQQHLQNQLLQGLVKTGGSQQQELAAMAHPAQVHHSPFAQMQVGSPPSTLQVPATPPAASPTPLRHTSQSPVRQDSPDTGRRPSALNLRQALSQPNPGHDDALAEAAMHAQAALHQTGALPAMGASPLRMPHGARALTEDAEGPRMSMAMRRQLGIAPTKSPSKASSASALLAGGNTLRSPVMSPSQSVTLPFPTAGGVMGSQEAVSQGLLLQQAALALQMQGTSTLYGVDPQQQADASTQALNAALRQQQYGTSTASELSQPTDDYADLVARLQSMCFGGLLGDPLGMGVGGGNSEEEQRTASTGSVSRFESAGSAQHNFDLDLGALTSQPQAPHTAGAPFSAAPGCLPHDPPGTSHSFFSY